MKFKLLFITFNIVLILSFLFIFFTPLAVFGFNFAESFWSTNWMLFIAFLFLIALVNSIFLKNWKLLNLLEKEDWPALALYLERKIYVKKHISRRYVKMLCDSYMLLSDFASVERLRNFVKIKKPAVLVYCLLSFTAILAIQKKYEEAALLLESYGDNPRVQKSAWLQWYDGFCRYAMGNYAHAQEILLRVLEQCKRVTIASLCVFLLEKNSSNQTAEEYVAISAIVAMHHQRLIETYSQSAYRCALEKEKTELSVVVLASLFDEVEVYLYKENT